MSSIMTRPLTVAARRLLTTRGMCDVAMELRPMQKTTAIERKILVWGRAFKTAQDIPEWISMMKMKRAYDIFRIELNTAVVAFGALFFLGAVANEHHKRILHIHEVDPQWSPK
jgi:hypothetical protein